MVDITSAMKCALSVAIGLALGFAIDKIGQHPALGYLIGVPLLVFSVASALDVFTVDWSALFPSAADPLKETISIYTAEGAIDWIGNYVTVPENARYLGPALAGFFIGMALA